MTITVVMCTRNRLKLLLQFTRTLFSQSKPPKEYIIVDSSDLSIFNNYDFINEVYDVGIKKGISIKCLSSSPGLTHQRNIGIQHATMDLIFFFDDDILLTSDYLMILANTFEMNPHFMGGMGSIRGFDDYKFRRKLTNFLKGIMLQQISYGDGRFFASGWPRSPFGRKEFMTVEVLAGGLTGYRRHIFQEFTFDESYTKSGPLEDADFSRRVSFKHKLFYNPDAVCFHLHEGSERFEGYEFFENLTYNYLRYYSKNYLSRNILYLFPFLWAFPFYLLKDFKKGAIPGKLNGVMKYLVNG